MTLIDEPTTRTGALVLGPNEGEHSHFLNNLATIKVATGDAPSGLTAVEFRAPRDFGPPLHVHREEDEMFYVLDGSVIFTADGVEQRADAGALVLVPSGVTHTFLVLTDEARLLTITAGSSDAPAFDVFVDELGAAVEEPAMPEPEEIDPGHVAAVCDAHGISVVGPPPMPR